MPFSAANGVVSARRRDLKSDESLFLIADSL